MKRLLWFIPGLVVVTLSVMTSPPEQSLQRAFCPVSTAYPLGCSPLGENLLSQLAAGTGETSLIAIGGRLLSLLLSAILLITVYLEPTGFTNSLNQRLAEALLTIPSLLLALSFQAALGSGAVSLMAAIAISEWATNYRWLQTRVQHYNRETFMEAALVMGAPPWLRLHRHLWPHLWHDVVFLFFAFLPGSFLTVSALEFLGFSLAGRRDGLGYLIAANKDYIFTHPLLAIAPSVVLVLLILYFTILKDKALIQVTK